MSEPTDRPPEYIPPALDDAFRDKPPEPLPSALADEPLSAPGQEERTWGMFCHLASLAQVVVPGGGIVGPLVCWLLKKEGMPFVDRHGKESVNFQLNMLIAVLISIPLGIVTLGLGFLLTAALGIYAIVMPIIAGLKANEGKEYRYAYVFRLIK